MRKDPPRILPLDGLRGAAALAVVFYHCAKYASPGAGLERAWAAVASVGWMGVDVFFVLSGYLITTLLLGDRRAGRTGLPEYLSFVRRRAFRILPGYALALTVVLFAVPLFFPGALGPRLAWLRETQLWHWVLLQNWQSVFDPGARETFPLIHLWTLAVEMQFYALWPIAVLSLRAAALKRLCLAAIAAALCLRIGLVLADVPAVIVYTNTFTRMDTLAAGCLIALTAGDRAGLGRLASLAPPVIAASVIVLASLAAAQGGLYGLPLTQSVGFTAIAAAAGGLVALLLARPRYARLASGPVIRYFGRISYALYVIHYPVVRALQLTSIGKLGPLAFTAVAGGASVLLASATTLLFEEPILAWSRRRARLNSRR